ncbi:MAG: cache domain-containing protein [Proteobacteria bacterium]|nr:hypothetical protein [Desulfobulbaceae bacterium]MBU4152048.1 cache domain-containing protein [Pseudomonadota bacterium]
MSNRTSLNDRHFDTAKTILPAILTVLLFVVACFGILLPAFQQGLFNKEKDSSKNLAQVAISILAHYDEMTQSAHMPLATAQNQAIQLIRNLRYGPEDKNYFWINDLTPTMVMHPYRPDLEGHNVGQFLDPEGIPLFINFVRITQEKGSGYVPYVWQHHDNQQQLKHKLSYVELFAPWGWIVGTGVYLDDAAREVANVTKKIISLTSIILAGLALLSAYMIRHGMRVEGKKRKAEGKLREHEEHLEELIKIRTRDLEKALTEVKKLSGFLPICASCKKIRDDGGYWQQVEIYIRDHSEAQFSHGICPDCIKKLYPEFAE